MDKTKVSVVIIAKNEEKKIGRCLESVRWADEVIVVDGYSDDRTADIARSSGARVIQHKFAGSFAEERNLGMAEASNDLVLQLDADDVVTDGFREKMEEALSEKERADVYKFRRKNFFLGHCMEHGGWCHYIPNLVNKTKVRFEGDVHEVPVYGGKSGVIEADIEHYPFDTISQFIDRQNRYTDIAARRLLKDRGALSEKEIRRNMTGRTLKLFWKSYVKKQGYKEGAYGLVFSILFALINFMQWAKYWELTKKEQ